MNLMQYPLPQPLPSSLVYDGIAVENAVYDPVARQYTARVYGVCRGSVVPLLLATAVAVRRIEDVVIADAEIDAMLTQKPELNGDRVAGAMASALDRLYALAQEMPEEAPRE